MVRIISSFVLLGSLASSALARFVCPGGNPHDTGKGMAAFRYVEVSYDVDQSDSAYIMLDGYNRMFDCTDECWRRGPSCNAVIYTGWNKKCKIIKDGHDLKLTNLKAYQPNSDFIAVAVKAEGAWQGACDSKAAKAVPISGKTPYEGCCDVWM